MFSLYTDSSEFFQPTFDYVTANLLISPLLDDLVAGGVGFGLAVMLVVGVLCVKKLRCSACKCCCVNAPMSSISVTDPVNETELAKLHPESIAALISTGWDIMITSTLPVYTVGFFGPTRSGKSILISDWKQRSRKPYRHTTDISAECIPNTQLAIIDTPGWDHPLSNFGIDGVTPNEQEETWISYLAVWIAMRLIDCAVFVTRDCSFLEAQYIKWMVDHLHQLNPEMPIFVLHQHQESEGYCAIKTLKLSTSKFVRQYYTVAETMELKDWLTSKTSQRPSVMLPFQQRFHNACDSMSSWLGSTWKCTNEKLMCTQLPSLHPYITNALLPGKPLIRHRFTKTAEHEGVLLIELPGVVDLNVKLKDNYITITGKKWTQVNGTVLQSGCDERDYDFKIPIQVKSIKDTQLDNGVLKLQVNLMA